MCIRDSRELLTVVDVLNQSITMMTRRNSEEQLATLRDSDVLVQPDMARFAVTDFGRGEEMIDAGYQAARALQPRFAALVPRSGGNPALSLARSAQQRAPVIHAIQVDNDSKVGDEVIRNYIRQPIGEPLDMAKLQRDMGTLYGLDYFERVQYRVVNSDERNTLVIDAREKRTGTDYLRLGLNLSDDFNGDSVFNLGASFRKNGINRLGAEWLTRVQLGDRQELFSEFYQPLDVGSRWFVAPNLHAEAWNLESVLNNDPIAEYRVQRYGYGFDLGRQIANNGELRFGIGQAWGCLLYTSDAADE